MIIAVKSSLPKSFHRAVLRDTYLAVARKQSVPYLFVVGQPTDDKKSLAGSKELHVHRDILLGSFIDNYNLTLKAVTALNWISLNCPNKWLLLTDDDALVNVPQLITFTSLLAIRNETAIYGHVVEHAGPNRHSNSNFFVPQSIWPHEEYPKYVRGGVYLISPPAVRKLANTAMNKLEWPS